MLNECVIYRVIRIDGDYAYLRKLENPDQEDKCVARAFLPEEITEGCQVAYEMLSYTMR